MPSAGSSSLRPEPPAAETDFAIELGPAGYIGQIGFHLTDGEAELGYWLGEPSGIAAS